MKNADDVFICLSAAVAELEPLQLNAAIDAFLTIREQTASTRLAEFYNSILCVLAAERDRRQAAWRKVQRGLASHEGIVSDAAVWGDEEVSEDA
ncbi:MAG: hypothetical protein AB1796_11820 [Bacillota bacterium]